MTSKSISSWRSQISWFEKKKWKIGLNLFFLSSICKLINYEYKYQLTAIKWLKYCRYGVKQQSINQSINRLNLLQAVLWLSLNHDHTKWRRNLCWRIRTASLASWAATAGTETSRAGRITTTGRDHPTTETWASKVPPSSLTIPVEMAGYVCWSWVFAPTQEFFTHLKTSPIQVKGWVVSKYKCNEVLCVVIYNSHLLNERITVNLIIIPLRGVNILPRKNIILCWL